MATFQTPLRTRLARLPVTVLLAGGLVLPGCVTTSRLSATGPADSCSVQRAALGESENFFAQSIIEGAAAGALTGALAGAIFGAATDGDVGESALIGAGAGALAGGVMGYYNARAANAADQRALALAIGQDATAEAAAIDRASVTFRALKECRFQQANRIKADHAAGRITREEAATRLAGVKALFDEELAVAEQLGANMDRRAEELQAASNQLLESDPRAKAAAATFVVPAPAVAGGPTLTAQVAANVRAEPNKTAARVGGLAKGERVSAIEPAKNGWVKIRTDSGLTGYVAERLFQPGAAATVAKAPPKPADVKARLQGAPEETVAAVEVAVATETTQRRRQSFHEERQVAQAESEAVFNLEL